MGCGPTFTFASNAYWYQKHECGWRGDWKKEGGGGEANEGQREATVRVQVKILTKQCSPQLSPKCSAERASLMAICFLCDERPAPTETVEWMCGSTPAHTHFWGPVVHCGSMMTQISLALWIETSHFPALICPLLSSCAVVPWTTRTILDCVRLSMVESLCVSYLLIPRFLLFHSVFLRLSKVILLYF